MIIIPKVSIIVPIYKTEAYLPYCIDSLLAQTFTNFEILLINDGSPDRCGIICDEYTLKDNRVRVFHKENGGVSSARNLALDNANGEWIAFCDSDDWVGPSWLEDFINNINNADIVIQAEHVTKNRKWSYDKKLDDRLWDVTNGCDDLFNHLLENDNIGYPHTKSFKKSIIKNYNIRFDTNIALREDELFVFTYMKYVSYASTINKNNYWYEMPNYTAKYHHVDSKKNVYTLCLIMKTLYELLYEKDHTILQKHLGFYAIHIYNYACDYSIKKDDFYIEDFCFYCKNTKFPIHTTKKARIAYYLVYKTTLNGFLINKYIMKIIRMIYIHIFRKKFA